MGALIWIVVPTSPAFIPFIQKIVQKLIFNPFVRGKSAKNFFFNLISYHNSLHLSFYIAISIYFLGSVARLLYFVICLHIFYILQKMMVRDITLCWPTHYRAEWRQTVILDFRLENVYILHHRFFPLSASAFKDDHDMSLFCFQLSSVTDCPAP